MIKSTLLYKFSYYIIELIDMLLYLWSFLKKVMVVKGVIKLLGSIKEIELEVKK